MRLSFICGVIIRNTPDPSWKRETLLDKENSISANIVQLVFEVLIIPLKILIKSAMCQALY